MNKRIIDKYEYILFVHFMYYVDPPSVMFHQALNQTKDHINIIKYCIIKFYLSKRKIQKGILCLLPTA